jgi:hypothetical protein
MDGGGSRAGHGRAIYQEPSPAAMASGGRGRARPVILTLDLGTSVTKAALWDRTAWWPWLRPR